MQGDRARARYDRHDPKIEANGYTYIAGGNVYFDTSKVPDYGKLARLQLDEEKIRSRVENDPSRKPFDFVLWFTRYKYETTQCSGIHHGVGLSGWHIECSRVASNYLGERFDIHRQYRSHSSSSLQMKSLQSRGGFRT